ncbi:nucleotidyltransferase family protein [Azospirillum argentinense]|uniref:hypothetical protein n=1 Tax=Azospirillum argentinense TaxID=2970906 RepID=UPI001909F37E|nr:hypothetical protein [Azospirillum argentinense]
MDNHETGIDHLIKLAEEAYKRLAPALDAYAKRDKTIFLAKGRVKAKARVEEKIADRQNNGNSTYSPWHITDACAFRIICVRQSSMPHVLDHLITQANSNNSEFCFEKNGIKEIKLYTARPATDPLSIEHEVETIVRKYNLDLVYGRSSKESNYSSIHILIDCDINASWATRPITVEFQVRSVLEEVWGELDHSLKYSKTRIGGDSQPLHRHLNVLKVMLDGCNQYIDVIFSEASDQAPSVANIFEAKPIEADSDALLQLKQIPSDMISKVDHAYKIVKHANMSNDHGERCRSFTEGAQLLFSILSENRIYFQKKEDDATIRNNHYWLNMEYAYCRFQTVSLGAVRGTERENVLKELDALYDYMESQFTDDVAARFRHSTVLRYQRQYPSSASRLLAAINFIETDRDQNVNRDHWIYPAAYRHLGYTYWKMSESGSDDAIAESLEHLKKAVTFTRKALELSREAMERELCLNNLVYYAWLGREWREGHSESFVDDQTYMGFVKELRALVESAPPLEADTSYDTLCRAYYQLGDYEQASAMARHSQESLFEIIRARSQLQNGKNRSKSTAPLPQQYLDEDELDAFIFAQGMLAKPNEA